MASPTVSGPTGITGVWLIPVTTTGATASASTWVYVNGKAFAASKAQSANVFVPPSRKSKIVQLGSPHNHDISVSGHFVTTGGVAYTDWANRMEALVDNQGTYSRIILITPTRHYDNVVLHDGYSVSESAELGAASMMDVDFIATQLGA